MYVGLPNFSKNYTAIYQTLKLVEEVTKAFNNRKATGVFLIDIKKAFNKVWHYGLVSEMVTGSFLFYLTAVVHSHLMVKNFTDKVSSLKSAIKLKDWGPTSLLTSLLLFFFYLHVRYATIVKNKLDPIR
jgi:hypothetical protein